MAKQTTQYTQCHECEAGFRGAIPRHTFLGKTCPGSPMATHYTGTANRAAACDGYKTRRPDNGARHG